MKKTVLVFVSTTVAAIWLTTSMVAAQQVRLTVSQLEDRGISNLDDQALQSLIVDKTLVIQNLYSDEYYEASYYLGGWRALKTLPESQPANNDDEEFNIDPFQYTIAPYNIENSRISTTFGGENFEVSVYDVDGTFLAARTRDEGFVNWKLIAAQAVDREAITEMDLRAQGLEPLNERQLQILIVGNTLIVRNRISNQFFETSFGSDGTRTLSNISDEQINASTFFLFSDGPLPPASAQYNISGNNIITTYGDMNFEMRVYLSGDKYLGVRSGENGYANWELIDLVR